MSKERKSLPRRDFLKYTGLTSAGLLVSKIPLMAGSSAVKGIIPVNKNISPEWIKSLYQRGSATTYLKTKNELQYIGMPVGGMNTGGVYLGGDGRLWLWDIFNKNKEGVDPKLVKWDRGTTHSSNVRSRDGANYIEPSKDIRPLEQGFTFKIEYNGNTIIKRLVAEDWDEIAFEATYPLAKVHYTDKKLPLAITLEAYSPFIPMDEENSGLPATILSFTVKNNHSSQVKVSVLGFLENKTGFYTAQSTACIHHNTIISGNGMVSVEGNLTSLALADEKLKEKTDYGTMCISALASNAKGYTDLSLPVGAFSFEEKSAPATFRSATERLVAGTQIDMNISPDGTAIADFIISWYFPTVLHNEYPEKVRYYEKKFKSASEVAAYINTNYARLSSETKLWAQTWADSTLPHWFLERTLLNISTLATNTSYRFTSGRWWAWEGIGACAGMCTHVWQYAQAVGRLFPALERDTRERVDLRIAMQPDGGIIFRAENEKRPAIDGQAGTVLRIYREHQMSVDSSFLQRNWPEIKKATQFIINQDKNGDGMEDTPMENTLDAVWDGEIAWIVGLCIAAVKAGAIMAEEVGDTAFAKSCNSYVDKGRANMEKYLFNGEYFIHRPDPKVGRSKLGSYNTCHIDQVFGQSYAFQVGLGRVLDKEKTLSALKALWKYNFTTDVGPYIEENKGGRPYALAGEGGMIMNTNPKNEPKPYGDNVSWQLGYFHECMSGFEHQVASHMMAEGMTDESLILTHAIHDRYHAAKRNPFNEIECSDHYGRAMASYGTFITACGFEYHGPKGYMKFAPKWNAEDFKAPFTSAGGWGSYSQKKAGDGLQCQVEMKYGSLQLKSFGLELPAGKKVRNAIVSVNGQKIAAKAKQNGTSVLLEFDKPYSIKQGESLEINV